MGADMASGGASSLRAAPPPLPPPPGDTSGRKAADTPGPSAAPGRSRLRPQRSLVGPPRAAAALIPPGAGVLKVGPGETNLPVETIDSVF